MVRKVRVPGPNSRCAMGMAQFVEKILSLPRGPLCWMELRNPTPCSISIQLCFMVISIGCGVELGSALVPAVP